MDFGGRRRAGARSGVVAGSVWETRMKNDEVKGGIKVFNGDESNNNEESGSDSNGKGQDLKKGKTIGGMAVSGKRKTWKNESFEGLDKNPIQIAKGKTEPSKNSEEQCKELSVSGDGIKKTPIKVARKRSESQKNSDEHCKELSVSADGIRKSPAQIKKGRSEASKELVKSVDGLERSPTQIRKPRSEIIKGSNDISKEVVQSSEGIDGNSVQLRKAKSDSVKVPEQPGNGNEGNSVPLRKTKSEDDKFLEDQVKSNNESVSEKITVETEKEVSDEICKEFGVCQEKVISSSRSNGSIEKSPPKVLVDDEEEEDDDVVDADEDFDEEEEIDVEVEVEKKSIEIKKMNVQEEKPKKIGNEVKKFSQFKDRTAPFSSTVNKQPPPVIKRATPIYTNPTKPTSFSVSDQGQSFPQTQNKLQSLVDLIMWRDIPRSAFIFGIGTFVIISSSYAKDLNISFISVTSYLGLVYLAGIFLYRSIICRGVIDIEDTRYVLGEEESIWLLRLVLPYLNEFLLKLRALFSGDPATTMKLAVLLFVLARCGSTITVWKMAKLGFFGVFTVPKVCSSYSTQLTAYGTFWIRRFRDAWDSCTHKKAVAVAIFTLVWNLSSIVARVWAAFVLFVALRYYQQTVVVVEDYVEDEAAEEEVWQERTARRRQGLRPTREEANKPKKAF